MLISGIDIIPCQRRIGQGLPVRWGEGKRNGRLPAVLGEGCWRAIGKRRGAYHRRGAFVCVVGVAAAGVGAGRCGRGGERGAGQEARESVNIVPEKEVKQLPAHVPQREGCRVSPGWLVCLYISSSAACSV